MAAQKKGQKVTKKVVKKGGPKAQKKVKKHGYVFHVECKNPVEDGILKPANFVSFSFSLRWA